MRFFDLLVGDFRVILHFKLLVVMFSGSVKHFRFSTGIFNATRKKKKIGAEVNNGALIEEM